MAGVYLRAHPNHQPPPYLKPLPGTRSAVPFFPLLSLPPLPTASAQLGSDVLVSNILFIYKFRLIVNQKLCQYADFMGLLP